MNIPDIPVDNIAEAGGKLNTQWNIFFMQLITQLQTNAGAEGLVVPTVTTAELATIQAHAGLQAGTLLIERPVAGDDKLMVSIRESGNLVFKQVQLI